MTIETKAITQTQENKILDTQEGHYYEVKGKEIKPAKLSRTISAFGNADGGDLYIGISEYGVEGTKKKSWNGFENQESANSHIQAMTDIFPLGVYYSYEFLSSEYSKGLVLHVNINKTKGISKN